MTSHEFKLIHYQRARWLDITFVSG
jgi:hypothetical protein